MHTSLFISSCVFHIWLLWYLWGPLFERVRVVDFRLKWGWEFFSLKLTSKSKNMRKQFGVWRMDDIRLKLAPPWWFVPKLVTSHIVCHCLLVVCKYNLPAWFHKNKTLDCCKLATSEWQILQIYPQTQKTRSERQNIPTDLRRSFMLTVKRSGPLIEGLEKAVKDDKLPHLQPRQTSITIATWTSQAV